MKTMIGLRERITSRINEDIECRLKCSDSSKYVQRIHLIDRDIKICRQIFVSIYWTILRRIHIKRLWHPSFKGIKGPNHNCQPSKASIELLLWAHLPMQASFNENKLLLRFVNIFDMHRLLFVLVAFILCMLEVQKCILCNIYHFICDWLLRAHLNMHILHINVLTFECITWRPLVKCHHIK